MKKYDVVKLEYDLPQENLTKDMIGVIVEVFHEPTFAFEVEFTNDQGETIAEVALEPDKIEIVKTL